MLCTCVSLCAPPGSLAQVVNEHTAPVFTLRWNKRGDLLITGSADKGTKVLDTNTWRVKQNFTPHTSESTQRCTHTHTHNTHACAAMHGCRASAVPGCGVVSPPYAVGFCSAAKQGWSCSLRP